LGYRGVRLGFVVTNEPLCLTEVPLDKQKASPGRKGKHCGVAENSFLLVLKT